MSLQVNSASRGTKALLAIACALLFVQPAQADRHGRTNVNRNVNVNTHRNVNVDVDVDRNRHPVGRAIAVGATVAVTSAIVGSIVHSVPPSCVPVQVGPVLYQQCGSTWYQPQMAGPNVQYVVVVAPR